MEYAVKNSGWLMLDSVDTLFKNAKDRVYNEKTGGKSLQVSIKKKTSSSYDNHFTICT